MYLLCMIKARIRWCTCRVENILTLGKLLSLWFCFLLHSILFLISQTSYRTYKIISSYELARPCIGNHFSCISTSSLVPRPLYARCARFLRAWYPLFCACANLKPMNILKLRCCVAPARDVLRMNIHIKFTTSWQPRMQ